MPSTEDRPTRLANEHLDHGSGTDFKTTFRVSGVSSVDAVALIKQDGQEFGLEIPLRTSPGLKRWGISPVTLLPARPEANTIHSQFAPLASR